MSNCAAAFRREQPGARPSCPPCPAPRLSAKARNFTKPASGGCARAGPPCPCLPREAAASGLCRARHAAGKFPGRLPGAAAVRFPLRSPRTPEPSAGAWTGGLRPPCPIEHPAATAGPQMRPRACHEGPDRSRRVAWPSAQRHWRGRAGGGRTSRIPAEAPCGAHLRALTGSRGRPRHRLRSGTLPRRSPAEPGGARRSPRAGLAPRHGGSGKSSQTGPKELLPDMAHSASSLAGRTQSGARQRPGAGCKQQCRNGRPCRQHAAVQPAPPAERAMRPPRATRPGGLRHAARLRMSSGAPRWTQGSGRTRTAVAGSGAWAGPRGSRGPSLPPDHSPGTGCGRPVGHAYAAAVRCWRSMTSCRRPHGPAGSPPRPRQPDGPGPLSARTERSTGRSTGSPHPPAPRR